MKKILVVGMTDNYGRIESVIMSYYRAIDKTRFQCVFLANTPVMAYEDEIAQLGGIVIHVPARHQHPVEFYRSVHTFFRIMLTSIRRYGSTAARWQIFRIFHLPNDTALPSASFIVIMRKTVKANYEVFCMLSIAGA